MPAGQYSLRWDGTDERGAPVSSGVYTYRLAVGGHVQSGKMTLVK